MTREEKLLTTVLTSVDAIISAIHQCTDWQLQFEASVDGTPRGLVPVDPFFENKKTGEHFWPPQPEKPF